MKDRKNFFSGYSDSTTLDDATFKLLEENADHLIGFIYDEDNQAGLLGNPEIRIGLSIKIIHKLIPPITEATLMPIIKDIELLMESMEYLQSTGDVEKRLKCLEDELRFVQKYIDFDDTMSLNTEKVEPFRHTPHARGEYQKGQQPKEPGCCIQ